MGGRAKSLWTSVTAILAGLVSIAGMLLVLSSLWQGLLFLGLVGFGGTWGRHGTKALLCDLAARLACAAAGGFVTSLCAGTAKLGHSVVLGIVLLVNFLLVVVEPPDPAWHTVTTALLIVPAAGLGGYVGRTRRAALRAPVAPRRRFSGGVGWIAGLIVAGTGLHLLVDRLGIGFTAWDAIVLLAVAGLAGLLIRTAIVAPGRRFVRVGLMVLAALVIPVGGFVLLGRLFLGLSTVTASAVAPDGRMVVQLVDPGRRILDRNFSIRLRGSFGLWRHVWRSPDEGSPGGERFLWSRDGRHVVLVGPSFFARPESCLASGEFLYLHVDTTTGAVRTNARQSVSPPFTLADLAGVEFTTPLGAAGGLVTRRAGDARCEPGPLTSG